MHGFPATRNFAWRGWERKSARCAQQLDPLESKAEDVDHATGFSTWRGEEQRSGAGVCRCHERRWSGSTGKQRRIASPALAADSFHSDERDYHYGLKRVRWQSETAFSFWSKGGVDAVRQMGRAAGAPGGFGALARTRSDHRRRGFHRHQSRRPAALFRKTGTGLRRSFPARRRTQSGMAARTARRSAAVEIADVRGPCRRCGARCAAPSTYSISPPRSR